MFEVAHRMLAEADAFGVPPRGIAMPFGVIEPERREWRLAPDVWDRMVECARASTAPAQGVETRLFGIAVVVEPLAPYGQIQLVDLA